MHTHQLEGLELFVHWQRLTVLARKMGQVVVLLQRTLQHAKHDWAARIGYHQTDAALESSRAVCVGEEQCVMVPATEIHDPPVSVLPMQRATECLQSGLWGRARHDAERSGHARHDAEGLVHAKDCAEGTGVEIECPWVRFAETEDGKGCWLEKQSGTE